MTEKEFRQKLSDLCNEAFQDGLDSTAVFGSIHAVAHACEFILDMELMTKIKEGNDEN
jgi:hypothetical protein